MRYISAIAMIRRSDGGFDRDSRKRLKRALAVLPMPSLRREQGMQPVSRLQYFLNSR
jgi:hypothetical protein